MVKITLKNLWTLSTLWVLGALSIEMPCSGAMEISDPFEPLNRRMLDFNLTCDRWILKPLGTVYDKATPVPLQRAVNGVLSNLKEPVTFVSYCAQGEPFLAVHTLARFIINTTFGVFGALRLGESLRLDEPAPEQNLGHVLSKWGVPQGPYLMLPILGPSSPRDLTSKAFNMAVSPVRQCSVSQFRTRNTLTVAGVDLVDLRARHLRSFDTMQKTSLDFYVTIRSIFAQKTAVTSQNAGVGLYDEEGPEPSEDD